MHAEALPQLAARLNELAEYFGAKVPSNAALRVWLDALHELAISDVLAVLTDWPKSRAKFPLASEVLTIARDRISDRVERDAKIKASEARRAWSDKEPRGSSATSEEYIAFRRASAELAKVPKPHPRIWATKFRDALQRGENLAACQIWALREYAKKCAFVPIDARVGDVETEADREAKVEREAIQAESTF